MEEIAMSIIGLSMRFKIATIGFTPVQLDLVRSGRFCDTLQMRNAREIYIEIEAKRWEEYHHRTTGILRDSQMLIA